MKLKRNPGKPEYRQNIPDSVALHPGYDTSHGVIQGHDGVTAVDGKHQIIVHAEAFGEAQKHDLLKPMVEGTIVKHKNVVIDPSPKRKPPLAPMIHPI